ncbi:NADPH-dependent glutamate synthase [bacterium]|nr:NADPH-dependent glutamate synthase [bacterium]
MPLNLNRASMPEQDPKERRKNFTEVNLGLSPEAAKEEATRCLFCKRPTCVDGCPVHIDIPGFLESIKSNDPREAVRRIRMNNTLPAICGRVCPQETQCEQACVLYKKGAPIAIGALERYVGDYAIQECLKSDSVIKEKNAKIAVIGSGPSGLTCAGELRKFGYQVTVFEALHELGGVLAYGIPEFRLPKETIVKPEIENLEAMGVIFKTNALIGKMATLEELLHQQDFAAVYIATGSGYPQFMNIPGEDLSYVYSANEFLTRINLMRAYQPSAATPIRVGKRVAVIGGGNTAMDAARSALRMNGVEKVYLIYRRSEKELPARVEEVKHAKEEGIDLRLLTTPIAYLGDEAGALRAARCLRMALGEPDASGRCRPVPIEGSEYEIEIDSAVIAIGTQANPIIAQSTPGLKTNKWGYITADENGQTSMENVYAGGDIVSGAATVILAMGAGRKAALTIHENLTKSK